MPAVRIRELIVLEIDRFLAGKPPRYVVKPAAQAGARESCHIANVKHTVARAPLPGTVRALGEGGSAVHRLPGRVVWDQRHGRRGHRRGRQHLHRLDLRRAGDQRRPLPSRPGAGRAGGRRQAAEQLRVPATSRAWRRPRSWSPCCRSTWTSASSSSTGSEATEGAIRIMKRKTGKFEIISFYGGFHGRTYAAAERRRAGRARRRATGPPCPAPSACRSPTATAARSRPKPETCGMLCLDFLDDAVRANSTGSLAGVIVEPYQGAAGFIFPPEGWLSAARRMAARARPAVHARRSAVVLRPHRQVLGHGVGEPEARPGVHRQGHRQRRAGVGHRRARRRDRRLGAGRDEQHHGRQSGGQRGGRAR